MCGSVAAFFQTFKYYAISRKGLNDKRLFSCSKPCLFPKKGHLIFNKSYCYKGINMQMASVEEKTKPSIRLIRIIRSFISYTQAGISSHCDEFSYLFSCLYKIFFVSLPTLYATRIKYVNNDNYNQWCNREYISTHATNSFA